MAYILLNVRNAQLLIWYIYNIRAWSTGPTLLISKAIPQKFRCKQIFFLFRLRMLTPYFLLMQILASLSIILMKERNTDIYFTFFHTSELFIKFTKFSPINKIFHYLSQIDWKRKSETTTRYHYPNEEDKSSYKSLCGYFIWRKKKSVRLFHLKQPDDMRKILCSNRKR